MAEVRYTGNAAWTRSVYDEDGVFSHFDKVMPGDVVDVPDAVAKGLVRAHLPIEQRNFELVVREERPVPKEAPKAAHPQARKA